MVRPGDRLGERYVVIEQIAAGGMGTLWRAHHVDLDVDVALKVVSARAATPASLKRFKREAQAAARLRSPNIVQVLDYGEINGEPYLAMELLKGEDLATRIARGGKIPVDRAARILDGIAKAVELAHGSGIIHRDLKPGNVFIEKVGDDEIVKILDFGIAKDLGAVPDPGSTTGVGVVGSPAYMSPEQVWAKKVGFRADVWAMGVVAFEMLTGKNPFMADTLAKIFENIIREPLPKVRDYEPNLPETLDPFFERALARNATERIGSAKELAEAFHSALEGRALPPMPVFDPHATTADALRTPSSVVDTVRRRDRPRQKSRARVLAVGGALVLISGIALYATSKGAPPEPPQGESAAPKRDEVAAPLPPVPAPVTEAAVGTTARTAALEALEPPRTPSSATALARSVKAPASEPSKSASPMPASSTVVREASSTPSPARDPRFGIPVDEK